MGTPVIVETQVRAERGGAASRAGERVSIGPFTEQRLNEALGLAVGARRIGPRKPMPQLPRATDAREAPRFVARPVVGEDPSRADASATKPGQRVLEKRGAGAPALGAADLHIRQAGGVIDRDVSVLIADLAPPFRLVTVNTMPHAVPKAPAMTLPDPKARTRAQTKAKEAPSDAIAPRPSIGERPREGTARVRGQGFGTGLSSSGGSGGGVQLDGVTDFCCPEYIDQMRVFIQRNWEQGQGVAGSTGVKFTIMRNGMIQTPQVERPSGFDVLDLAAIRALQRTTLPPLPNEFPNPTLTVHMRFDYSR